jgi:hypothetical protein
VIVVDRVFLLWHNFEIELETDNDTLIGVYSTKEKAERALGHASSLPGFSDYPDGFEISEYLLDQNYWPEGFVIDVEEQTRG